MRRYGRACQVGFQSFGSRSLAAAQNMIAERQIGDVTGIGVTGLWARGSSYYSRARWAGRRWLDGIPVMDGALTNPFAHAVATALALSGSAVTRTETDLYHANDVEADDTSCLRVRTASGITIATAVTLCAEHPREPEVAVRGTAGQLALRYTRDEILSGDGPPTVFPRTGLLENLLAHVRDPGVPLIAPLARFREFTVVVDAIAAAPPPTAIPADYWRLAADGDEPHRVIPGIDALVHTAATQSRLFRETGAPWAVPGNA
jgi:predicted dehydrogenase